MVLATSEYFLASWLSQGRLHLRPLFDFLSELAYIIYLLVYLFAVGMTKDKFKVEVLGDLTEEEAHKFVYGDGVAGGWPGIINIPSGTKQVPAGAQSYWPAIYERCGGNIGLLKQCVAEAQLVGNWDGALY